MRLKNLHGEIPVDSGRILLVDPCHLPADLVDSLTRPNLYDVTVGLLVPTMTGDGMYPVVGERGALRVLDPYAAGTWAPAKDGAE